MSTTAEKLYQQYVQKLQQIADLKYAAAVLQWDQETYLPAKGAESRARQLATLAELAHSIFIEESTGDLLNELLEHNLNETERRNVLLSAEDYNKAQKLDAGFVRKMSETVSSSYHAWIEARQQNSFSIFEPQLSKLIELKKQEAEMLGYETNPYDALIDQYEKGATTTMIDEVFSNVLPSLLELLEETKRKSTTDDAFLYQHFPKEKQWEWGMYIARELGFDFSAGRQDISEHPFTVNFCSKDVRITTRIDENDFANMTWSTIHEVGHALYEQGLPANQYGLPLGEYASLSVHESQSRLWENCVGRGVAFWNYYFPRLNDYFPQQFNHISFEQFIRAINKVRPSLIRTEADELTYHLHVMIRYELEKKLITGDLNAKDIPAYWNENYKKYLGVTVPDDKHGCLQDVHWSHGSFGYFATYSLGSFYAAQFWQQANIEIPELQHTIANTGNIHQLLQWLRSKVHKHGRYYDSNELCRYVTGKPLDSTVFVQYLKDKIYTLQHTNI